MASKLAAAKVLVVLLLLVCSQAQAARSSLSSKRGEPSFLGRIGRYITDVPKDLLKQYANHCGQVAVSECLKVRNPECLKVGLEECGLKP